MLDFMTKYMPIIASIFTFIVTFCKMLSMFKATKIEKNLETNIQRVNRDIVNVLILFAGVLSICFIMVWMTQDKENTIHFSLKNAEYSLSGDIVEKETNTIVFITDESYEIDVTNGKYQKNISKLNAGQKYVLKNKSDEQTLLTGVVPTKDSIESNNLFSGIVVFIILFLFVVYIYYMLKNIPSKKNLLIRFGREQYTVIKTISKNRVLLQKIDQNEHGIYRLKDIYRIINWEEIYSKDLEYENSEKVKRENRIVTYNYYKKTSKIKIVRIITMLLLIFSVCIGVVCYYTKENIFIIIGISVLSVIIVGFRQRFLYCKGKEIMLNEEENNRYKIPMVSYDFSINKKEKK